MAAARLAICAVAALAVLARGQGMPKWIPAEAKDLFGELDEIQASGKAAVYGEEACDVRARLLKLLGPVTGPEKGQIMLMVLGGLGHCELRKRNFAAATRRFESAISEMNAPSEEALMQHPQAANIVLLKNAGVHMKKLDASRSAVEIRRARTLSIRERAKSIKNIAKHNKVPAGQESVFVQQIMEKAKAGGQEAVQVKPIVGMINSIDSGVDLIDELLKDVDLKVIGNDEAQKKKRQRLQSSAGPHVPAVLMNGVVDAEHMAFAASIAEKAKDIAKEVADAKDLTAQQRMLLKRAKDGAGCEKLPVTCKAVKEVPDLGTNPFGETRIVALKKDKKQSLDLCETNANVLLLLPLDAGVSLTVGDEAPRSLEAQVPVVVDHCLPLSLVAASGASVLSAQAWHPEYSNIERTTEVRERASKWNLKEDDVKEITKNLNAHSKKGWEKALKQWQASPVAEGLRNRLEAEENAKRQQKEAAEKEAEEKAKSEDQDRKKALEELERKRAAKREAEAKKEKERLERKARMEAEKAKKDPWLLDPTVKEAEEKLEELKQERRDANAKLEFDVTKQLTKDINAQERALAKAIKKAKKAYKKNGGVAPAADKDAAPEKKKAEKGASSGGAELAEAEKKLADLKKRKEKAAEDENFKLAKQLKQEQALLEKEVAALRSKSEL
eukprot:TRINITY_DN15811_c0_g1_i1.p1 TRINITY_DN15811_c0_g1~~TRINITY_DN15811_c0_g1_i1.p1  ORF type:complete len:688 (-),score=282.46 TRINITY_DN15811_c0_g1_i1:48-2060(-)